MYRSVSFIFIVFILGNGFTHAAEEKQIDRNNINIQTILRISSGPQECLQVCTSAKKGEEFQEAKRGCCSWHHGVCGCSPNGRTQCCDGSLSPSCGC